MSEIQLTMASFALHSRHRYIYAPTELQDSNDAPQKSCSEKYQLGAVSLSEMYSAVPILFFAVLNRRVLSNLCPRFPLAAHELIFSKIGP